MDGVDSSSAGEQTKQYCDVCAKAFSTKSNLLRHQRKGHVQKVRRIRIPCGYCECVFSTAANLRRHKRKFHTLSESLNQGNFVCSECMASFLTKKAILRHYKEIHAEIILHKEHLGFFSLDDFLRWKIEIEKLTASQFVTLTGSKDHKVGKVQRYVCRQGGKTRLRNFGERASDASSAATNRRYCPAEIFAHEIDGKIFVDFYATHLGHPLEPSPKLIQNKKRVKVKREQVQTSLQALMAEVEKCESYQELDLIGKKLDEIAPLLAEARNKSCDVSETFDALQFESNAQQFQSYAVLTKPL